MTSDSGFEILPFHRSELVYAVKEIPFGHFIPHMPSIFGRTAILQLLRVEPF